MLESPELSATGPRVDRDMPETQKPVVNRKRSPLYVKLRMYYRLARVALHVAEGFVVALGTGIFFLQYRPYQQPIIRW